MRGLSRIALLALFALLAAPMLAQEDRPLVVTDSRADRGMLAPYLHSRNGIAYLYTSYVFDSLVSQDRQGRPAPGLAASWTTSPDGLTADLQMDTRARWHDGKPVTARDAAFTFAYMARRPYPFVSLKNVAGAEALSDSHLRIRLKTRDAGLVSGLLMALPILPEHIYASQEAPERFTAPEAATGSGPYRLAGYDKVQGRYMLEAVPDYYAGAPRFPRLMIVAMAPDAAIRALRGGEIDVISDLPVERAALVEAQGLQVVRARSGHVTKLAFNHRGLFGARAMRQALAQALDRLAILDITAPNGAGALAETGYFQQGSPWREDRADPAWPHDPARAAELLEAQGFTRDGAGRWRRAGSPVTLRLVSDESQARVAQVVADQLDTFGFGVDLRLMERTALQALPPGGDYDLLVASVSTTGDPGDIATRVTGEAWNADRYAGDGRIAAALEAARQAATPEERLAHLHAFQRLYAEELPSLMLVDPVMAAAHGGRIALDFMPDGARIGIPTAIDKSAFLQE
ncbi:ABC transporter substrate-binding protein [Paracoccus binzhouensis]|uniref:ABC transporter substrate-binding protein n=1 Tax=Paracoccus binzhouensis TaxID=2796149 RepID=UPI0018EF1790|nr:ABC transporter substrate-binding protein [Paracoccus binzhouensis]